MENREVLSLVLVLLSILIRELLAIDGGASVTCESGISYNKGCESACNAGYEVCVGGEHVDVDAGVARALSVSAFSDVVACREAQGKCMRRCYAAAAAMCSGAFGGDRGDDGHGDGDDGDRDDGRSPEPSPVGGSVAVVGIAATACLVALFRLKRRDDDRGSDGAEMRGIADRQELIGRDPSVGLAELNPNTWIADATMSAITSPSTVPTSRTEANDGNQDQCSGVLIMHGVPSEQHSSPL